MKFLIATFYSAFVSCRNLLLAALLLLVGGAVLLTLTTSLKSSFTINVGELGDAPFVSGFNSDEAGALRFRWTGSSSAANGIADGSVTFLIAPAAPARLHVTLGGPPAAIFKTLAAPISVTILVNNIQVGTTSLENEIPKSLSFDLPANLEAGTFKVEIKSPLLNVAGDSRKLGVRVLKVEWQSVPTLRWPAPDILGWVWLYLAAVALAISRPVKKIWQVATGALVALLPWLILPLILLNLWYTPYLLPWLAWIAVAMALLVWRRELGEVLLGWPARLEQGKLARNLLMIASTLYFILALLMVSQMDFIGHADYADNGVVARNLLRGNGFAVDYAAQFYQFYPQLPHPADTWPLLQPLLTVPFMLLFGPTAFAAKLPNLLLMVGLAWAVFYYVRRYFNRQTALGAVLLTLASPVFLDTVAYPINDLAFTLLLWLTLFSFYTALIYKPIAGGAVENTVKVQPQVGPRPKVWLNWLGQPTRRLWLISGGWGGLLFLSKPSGAVILVALGLAALFLKFWRSNKVHLPWRSLLLWGGIVVLITSPYFVRNQLDFGKPVYSTESYDAWLNKWSQSDESIYNLYYPDHKALPSPNLLLAYGYDSDFKIKGQQFAHQLDDLWQGKYEAPLLLILAVLGLAVLPRRSLGLLQLVSWVFICYELFINLYWHYEPRYFLAWRPWLYTLGIYGLSWIYAKIKTDTSPPIEGDAAVLNTHNPVLTSVGEALPANFSAKGRLGGWVVAGAFWLLFWPNLTQTIGDGFADTGKTGIVIAAGWLKHNTPSDAVVMSRSVWEMSFHADRRGVMVPNNASLAQIEEVMRDYGVRYLQLDHLYLDQPEWQSRPALRPLITRALVAHFSLLYDENGFLIYQWDGILSP